MTNDKEKEFEQYRDALKDEIILLASFIHVYKRIIERLKDREKEINIAPAFFNTVLFALFHSTILWTEKLCSPKSQRGLYNFLKFVENNRGLFDEHNWNRRRPDKNRGARKYLKEKISFKLIQEDFQKLESLPIKEDIKKIRDKYTAHFDKDYFYDKDKLRSEIKILLDDLIAILKVIKDIYNRYSVAYDGVQNYLQPYNINDIDYILDTIHYDKK